MLDFSPKVLLLTDKNFSSLLCWVKVVSPYNLLRLKDQVAVKFNNEALVVENIERDTAGVGRYRVWFSPPHEVGVLPLEVTIGGRPVNCLANLTVYGWPEIKAIQPQPVKLGEVLTIYGSNFIPHGVLGPGQGMTAVVFPPLGDKVYPYKYINDGQVEITVPPQAASGIMAVWVGMQRLDVPLVVQPEIRAISPLSAWVGDEVTIYVVGVYGFNRARDRVEINGLTMPIAYTGETAVTVTVPPGATTGKIRLYKTIDDSVVQRESSVQSAKKEGVAWAKTLVAESEFYLP